MDYTMVNAQRRAHEDAALRAELDRQQAARDAFWATLPTAAPAPASVWTMPSLQPASLVLTSDTARLQQLLAATLRRHPTRAADIEQFLRGLDDTAPMTT